MSKLPVPCVSAVRPIHRRLAAFTLIELLVVIAIIGVLAGIALPVINSVMRASRATTCVSNLRQLGGLAFLYAGDHDGMLPESLDGIPGRTNVLYPELLWPYLYKTTYPGYSGFPEPSAFVGTIFHCPELPNDQKDSKVTITALRSYGMNYQMGDGDPSTAERLATVPHPLTTMLLCDNYNGTQATQPNVAPRHRGYCNVLFCDGHADRVTITSSIQGSSGYYKDPFWGDRLHNSNQ